MESVVFLGVFMESVEHSWSRVKKLLGCERPSLRAKLATSGRGARKTAKIEQYSSATTHSNTTDTP